MYNHLAGVDRVSKNTASLSVQQLYILVTFNLSGGGGIEEVTVILSMLQSEA